MTEAERLTTTEPTEMLEFLEGKAIDRKLRLLACCVRHSWWPVLSDARSRTALEVSERFADGIATEDELFAATEQARAAWLEEVEREVSDERTSAAELVYWAAFPGRAHNRFAGMHSDDAGTVCGRVREIFGNPFRPITLNPTCLTSTVLSLATNIYNDKAFDRMPILADALQDAGCDNEEILDHCRQPSEHVRACWVVDLLLDKK